MKEKYSNITGIILSGGLSTRMGIDKALLKIGDKTIIEQILGVMSNIFENILISTNDNESYRFLNLPIVEDVYKDHGPISGIHAVLAKSKTDKNFVISCDLPLISEIMIRYVVESDTAKPISIPVANGRSQYLCGVYHKALIPLIEEMINDLIRNRIENRKSSASMKQFIEKSGAELIETENLPFYSENLFFNMNCTMDYDFIKMKMSK